DLRERLVDLVGEDAFALLLVAEIEHDAVREAVLERDALDARGALAADVLDGVEVCTHVVVLDHQVAPGERRRAVLGRADPFREASTISRWKATSCSIWPWRSPASAARCIAATSASSAVTFPPSRAAASRAATSSSAARTG